MAGFGAVTGKAYGADIHDRVVWPGTWKSHQGLGPLVALLTE
jgi:hypothetical protein